MEISHQLIKSNPKKHTLQSDNGLKIFRDNKINFSKDLLKLLQNKWLIFAELDKLFVLLTEEKNKAIVDLL